MKQQVIFIHGGESKENYKDFEDYLEKLEYKPFEEKKKKWKTTLSQDLGNEFQLFDPLMPNKGFADYNHWKIIFEKTFKYLNDNVIIIGHSLGGTFLTKYLNENIFPVKISKIIFISSSFKDSKQEKLGNFNFDTNLKNLKKYEKDITFFHSKDDEVVPFEDLMDYKKIFPNSKYIIFEDKFHFIDETFPELIEYIYKIT